MNEIQRQALERIQGNERLRDYETELMVDWSFEVGNENWEYILRADVDELLKLGQEIRAEYVQLYGVTASEVGTWEEIMEAGMADLEEET